MVWATGWSNASFSFEAKDLEIFIRKALSFEFLIDSKDSIEADVEVEPVVMLGGREVGGLSPSSIFPIPFPFKWTIPLLLPLNINPFIPFKSLFADSYPLKTSVWPSSLDWTGWAWPFSSTVGNAFDTIVDGDGDEDDFGASALVWEGDVEGEDLEKKEFLFDFDGVSLETRDGEELDEDDIDSGSGVNPIDESLLDLKDGMMKNQSRRDVRLDWFGGEEAANAWLVVTLLLLELEAAP